MENTIRTISKNTFCWMPQTSAVLLFLAAYMLCIFYVEEDSYIYFRIAENIANGFGYVFNRGGDPVEAGSGPLWQYLLAVGEILGLKGLIFSKILGGALGAASIILAYKIVLRFGSALAAFGSSAAIACNVPFVWWSGSGLESSAFVFLQLSCLYIALSNRIIGIHASLAFAALLFVRPEAFLLIIVFLFYLLWTHQFRSLINISIILAMLFLGYLVFRYFYFGDFQISAYYAKIALKTSGLTYAIDIMQQLRMWYGLAFIPLGAYLAYRKGDHKGITLVFLLVVALMFFATTNHDIKIYFRFFSHALPLYLVLVGISFSFIVNAFNNKINVLFIAAFLSFVIAVSCVARVSHHSHKAPNPFYSTLMVILDNKKMALDSIKQKLYTDNSEATPLEIKLQQKIPYVIGINYQALVGRFLAINYPKDVVIGYDQMGQTPFFAGQDKTFIDFLGLVSHPVALAIFNQGAERSWMKSTYKYVVDPILALRDKTDRDIDFAGALTYVENANPDIVMIHHYVTKSPRALTGKIAQSQWLKDNYTKKYNIAYLIDVYERNDTAFPLAYNNELPLLAFSKY